MMNKDANTSWALFILRFGLGIFLILWSIDKVVEPEITVDIFSRFYHMSISSSVASIIGLVELVISLFFIFGVYKTVIYGAGATIHVISTIASYRELLSPFGENHLFIASIPIMFAFIALFISRHHDDKFTLGKKKSLFS